MGLCTTQLNKVMYVNLSPVVSPSCSMLCVRLVCVSCRCCRFWYIISSIGKQCSRCVLAPVIHILNSHFGKCGLQWGLSAMCYTVDEQKLLNFKNFHCIPLYSSLFHCFLSFRVILYATFSDVLLLFSYNLPINCVYHSNG